MDKIKKHLNLAIFTATRSLSVLFVVTALLAHSFMPTVVNAKTGVPLAGALSQPTFPMAAPREPVKTMVVVATAYNSLPGQTDSTPDITASGTRTRHGVVAANFLRIGTNVRFPDLYGNTIFIVEDRMNARYGLGRVDIWMENYSDAKIFGAKRLVMEIF